MEKSLFTSSQGRYDINRYLDYVFQGNNDALRNRLDFLFSEGNLDDAQYDHLSGLIGLFNQAKSELAPVLVDSESGSELLELPALMNEVYPKILYTLIEDSSQDVQPIDELWKITTSIIDRNAQYLPLSLVKWKYLVAKLLDEHQKNNVVDSYEEMPQKLKDDIGPTVPNEITIFQKKSDEASIVEEGLALPEVLLLAIIHDGITHLLDTKDFSKNTLGNNLESALRSMCEVIKEAIQGDIKISSDELEKSLSLLDRFEVVEQKSRWGRGFSFLTHYQEYLYALSEGVLSKEKYKEFEKGLVLFETDLEVLSDSKIDTLINRLPPAFSNKSLVLETGFDLTEEDLIKPDVEYPKDTDPDSFKPTSYFSSSVVTKAYLRLDDSKKDVARLAFRYVLGKYDDLLAGDKPIPDEDQKILDRNGISTDFESRIAYFSKITPLGLSYFENSIKIVESENGKSLIGRAVSQFQSLSEISLLEVHVFKRMETEDVDGGAYVQDSKEVITLLKDQIEETLTNLGKIRGDLESSHPSVENYAQRVSQLFNSKNLGDLKKDIELANTTELDQVMTSAYRDLEDLKFVLDTETLAVDINQVLSILDKIKVAQVVVGRYWLSATAVDLKDSQLMMPKESRASMRTLYEGLINLNTSENGDYARVLEDFQKTISNWSDNQLHLSLKEMVAQIEFQFDAASKGITLEKEYGNPISDFAKGDLGTDDIIGFLASVLTPKTDGKDWYRWLLVAKEALSAFERGDKDEAQAFYLMARHSNLASTLSEQYDDIDSLFSTLDLAMNACMVAMAATGGTVLASVGEATSGIKKGTWAWQMLNATGFVASNMVMDAAFLGHSTVDPNDPVIKQGLVVIKEIALMTGMFKYLGYVMGGFQKTFSGPILRVVEERVGRVLTQGEQSYLFEQFLKLAKNASHSSLKTVGFVYEVNAFLAWGIFRAHLEMGLDSSGITSEEIFVQKLDWNNIKHEAAFLFGLKIGNTLAHPMTDILVGKTLGPKRAEAINNAEVEWLRLSSESERISSVLSELRSRENLKAEDTQKLHGLQKEMVSVAREINALVVRLMQNGISLNFEGMNFLRDVNGMVRSDKSLGLDSLQDIEIKRTPDGKYIVPDHVIRFAMMAGELSHSTVDGVYVLTKSTGRRVYIVQRSRVKGLSSEVKKEGKKFAPELTKWVLTRGWGRELLSNDPEIFRELVLGKASEVFTQALQIEDPKEQKQAINLALMIAQSEIKTPEPTVPVAQRSEVGIKAKKSDKKDPTDPSSPLFGLELGLGPKLAFAGVGGDIKAEEARGRITVFRQDRSNEVSSSGRSSEVDGDIALDESGVEETGTTLTELIGVLEANKKVVLERLIDISEELSNEEVQRFSDEIGLVEDRIVHWKTELTRLETTYGRDRKLYEQDIRIGQNLLLDKISRIGSELFSPEYDLRTESTDGLRSRVSTGDDTKTPLKPDKPADVDTISSLVNHDVGYGKRLQLRPHQVSVLNKFKGVLGMLRKLAQSGSVREEQLRGTVVMPTGSGKTRTMVACFAAMIEQGMYVDGDKIIILNHTTQIHSQNLEVVGLLGSYFKTSLGRTLKVSEYKAERKDLSGDVVVVSVPTVSTEQRRQSFNEELVRALGANRVALVAVDEVHHLDTTGSRSKGSWRELLKTLRMVSPDLFRIGFTATPTGREGPYIDRVREIDMMQKGVTPRTYLVRVKSDVDLTGVKVGRSKEFVVKDLERTLLGYPERNRLIYGHLERFGMRSPRLSPSGRQGLQSSLVFGVDLNHVKMMANDYVSYFGEVIEGEDLRGRELVVLGENRGKISESDLRGALKKYEKGEIDGIAVVISGQTSPKIRQAILSNVENGSIEAVFNVDVLYEGADLHMFSHLIGGRPTFSTIRKGQERGRVNRRGPADVTVDGKLLNDRPKIIFDIEDQFSGRERAPINYWNLMGIPMGVSLVDSGRLIDVVAGKVVEKVNESGEGVSRNEEATNDLPPARPVNREVVTDQDARLIEMLQDILESRYSGDIYRMSLDLGVTEEDLTGLLEGRGWQNSRSFMRRLATLLYQDRETLVEIYNESRGLLDPDVTSNDIALLRGAVALYRDWEGGTGEIVIKGDDGLGEREIVVPLHALTTLSRGSVRLVQWRTLFSGLSFYFGVKANSKELHSEESAEKLDELVEFAFIKNAWSKDSATARESLLYKTREFIVKRFGGFLPTTNIGIDGVTRQDAKGALTKYISGKDIKYTGDFYLQLRALLQGLGCKEVDELFEEVAFEEQPDWDRDISTAGKRLLFETRKLVGRKFAGGLPTDTGIDGVSRQGVSSALTKYISGEDVKFSKVFPSQLRVLLQGLGCKEVDELFEEVAFEKQPDWDRDISTAGKRLLFETRKLVGRRFVEGLPTDTGIDGVGYQVKRSALYKYISGEEIKSSNSMSLDAFYSQVRSLLIGLDMDSLEADRLIRDARSESEIDKDDDNSSASAGGTGSPVLIKKSEPNSNSANHFQRLEDSNWSVGEALLAPLRGLYNAADSIAKSLANFVNDSFLNRAAVVGGPALIEGANALLTPSRRVNTSTLTQPMMMIGGDRGKVNVAKLERRLAEEMIDNPEYYSPENCDTNVAQFAKRNMTPEELEFARVLVFVPKDPAEVERMSDSILRPSALFTGEDTAWSIHFVLELGGRIYDYDYDGVPGEPIAKYCERMFPGQEIEIAPIKASTFVDFFDRGFPLGITVLKQVKREGIESFINKNHGEAQPYADLQSRAEIADRPVDDPAVIMDGLGMLTLKVSPSQAFTYKGLDFAFERLGHAIKRKNPERIYLKIVLPETTTITIEGVKRRVSESLISEAFEGPVTIALSRGSENFSAVVKAGKNHRVVSDLKRDVSSSTERAARFVVSPEGSIVKASPDNGEGNSVNWRPVRRVAAPSPRSSHLPKQPHGAYITPRNTGAFQGTITRQNVRMLLKDTEVLALDPEEEGRDAFYGFRVLKEGEELSRGECFWRIESIIPARNALEVKPLIFSARTFNFPNGLPDGLKNGQRIVLRFVVSLDRNPRPLVEPESISRMAAESGLAVDRRKDSEPGVFKPKLHTLPSYPDQILAQSINELVAKEVEVDIFFRDKSRIRGTLVAGKDGDYYITTPHDIVSDRLEDLIPFVEGDVAYVVPVNNTVDAKSLNKRFIKVENPQIEHGSIIHVDDSGKGPVIVVDFREPFLKIFLERNVQRVKDRYAEELSGATTGQEVRAVHREMAGTLLHVIRSFSLKQEIVNVDSFEPGLYTLSELLDYSSDIASNILMQIAMQYLGINSELQIGDTRDAYREPGRVLLADPWRKGSWVVSDDAKLTSEYALYDASEAFQIQGSSDSQYLGFRPNGKKIVRNRLEDERPLDESLENTFLFAPTVTPGSGDWTLASTSWTKKLPLPLQMAIADVKKESSDINHFQVAVETRRALRSRGIETVSFQYNVGDNLYYQIYIVDNLEFGKRSRSQTVKDKGAFDWLEALGRGSRKRSGRKLGLYFDTRYLIPGFDITASINATDMAMDWKSLSHEKFDPVTAHEGVHFVFNTAEHFDTAVILRRLADSTSNLYEGEGVGMCVFYRESPMIIEGYDPVNRVLNLKYLGVKEKNVKVGIDELLKSDWYFGVGESVYESNGTPVRPTRPSLFYSSSHLYAALILSEYSGLKGYLDPMNGYVNHELDANVYVFRRSKDRVAKLLDRTDVPKVDSKVLDEVREESYWMGVSLKYAEAFAKANYVFCHEVIEALGSGNARIRRVRSEERSFSLGYDRVIEIVDGSAKGINIYYMSAQLNSHEPAEGIDWSLERDNVLNMLKTEEQHLKREAERVKAIENDADFYKRLDELRFRYPDIIPVMMSNVKSASLEGASAAKIYGGFDRSLEVFDASNRHAVEHATEESGRAFLQRGYPSTSTEFREFFTGLLIPPTLGFGTPVEQVLEYLELLLVQAKHRPDRMSNWNFLKTVEKLSAYVRSKVYGNDEYNEHITRLDKRLEEAGFKKDGRAEPVINGIVRDDSLGGPAMMAYTLKRGESVGHHISWTVGKVVSDREFILRAGEKEVVYRFGPKAKLPEPVLSLGETVHLRSPAVISSPAIYRSLHGRSPRSKTPSPAKAQ